MATLTGKTIKDTYKSLIKVNDNEELAATLQELTDGLGNGSGISINTSGDLKASGILEFGSLKDTGEDITIVKFVDQADGIGSNNNDTTIPTSAAVKDYVDTNVTAQDLDFTGNTGTGAVDLDSQTLNLIGANGVVTTASGQTITIDTSSLDTRLTTAEADIDTNTANIATEISDRTSADSTLQSNIDAEAATRLANDNTLQGNIDTEASTRSSADTTLQANIDTNTANISSNDTDIAGLDTRLTTAEGNITSNDTDIATNASNISTNTSNISTNTSNIATNVTDIATNATNISSNDTDITALQNDKYDKTGGTISGSVTISDDLTVNGTTTTVNTETLSVEDPLIEMANQNAANSVDTGFYAKYSLDAGATTKYAGLFKDASDSDTFKLFRGLEVEPTTTINTGGAGYALADLDVAGLSASSGTITGDLIVDTDTLYVDSSNNRVGIGTNSPDSNLHISSAASTPTVRIETTHPSGIPFLDLKGAAASQIRYIDETGTIQTRIDMSDNGGFSFVDVAGSASPRMVIDSSGNVGIGTSSPSYPFNISSTFGLPILIERTNSRNAGIRFKDNQTTSVDSVNIKADIDDFVITTGGSEAMRIDSSGRVGIGTDSPSVLLHVSGSSPIIQTQDTDGTNQIGRMYQFGADLVLSSRNNTSRGSFSFQSSNGTDTVERLRIDSNGQTTFKNVVEINVGDTITNPAAGTDARLLIRNNSNTDGCIAVMDFKNNSNFVTARVGAQFQDADDRNTDLYFMTRANGGSLSERMRIDSSGNVGIGTTNPDFKTHLYDSGNTVLGITAGTANYAALQFGSTSDTTRGAIEYYTGDDSLRLKTGNNTERMRILSSGNVGINQTSPTAALHVVNSSEIGESIAKFEGLATKNGYVYINADDDRRKSLVFQSGGVDKFSMGVGDSNELSTSTFFIGAGKGGGNNADFVIDSSGNVGIGINSPSTRLTIKDSTDSTFDTGIAIIRSASSQTGYINMVGGAMNFNSPSIPFAFRQSGSEKMRIDADGDVGIGTSSPSAKLQVRGSSEILRMEDSSSTGNPYMSFYQNGTRRGLIQLINGGLLSLVSEYGDIRFMTGTGGTEVERMRITSGGQVRINKTSSGSFGSALQVQTINGSNILELNQSGTGNYLAIFTHGSTVVGAITENGTSTSYGTTSDYRLKENVVPMEGALDRVDALKPSRFNFIADADKTVDGFIAHEVAEVVPEAISGEKDAVDEEGNAIYQGIDQSKLVPLLVGAIQELKAEIETLKSQIQ